MNLIRLPSVKAAFGYRSNASIYNAINNGLLTKGVAIGERARAWPDHEVQAIVAARVAGHTNDQIRQLVNELHAKRSGLLAQVLEDCTAEAAT